MYAIETFGLTKKYKDVVAVDNLELRVESGELYSLLGVNGAGKTTAIRMLCCIVSPTSGDALLRGKSVVRESGEVKKMIAVSPQETAVAAGLTVRENLELVCGVHGYSREKTVEKIRQLVKEFDLEAVLSKKAGKLSGGWQRRLSIAMALACEPEILFLDEPTLGLDVLARAELWDIIRALRGKVTILLTTHYMEEAEALSDKVGIMRDGRLLLSDTVSGIKETAGCESFEEAFIRIVKGVSK